MIAKGKSISHGAAMVDYAAGRDKAQFLTSRFMNLDFEETFGMMPDNVWNSFKIHAMRHPHISNTLMRFELAPSREETKGWTHDDWKDFLNEFINIMDSIRLVKFKDKKGKWRNMEVKPTNLKNSQSIAYLHLNTDDNHLHFLVNRIDENGNLNDDSFLRNRCFEAAQLINARRGWQNTLERSQEIKDSIKSSIYDALKPLGCFTWDNFIEAMKAEGIIVKPKYDSSRKVVSYRVWIEGSHCRYNASDIARNLTAAHIAETCMFLHDEYEKERLRAYKCRSFKEKAETESPERSLRERPENRPVVTSAPKPPKSEDSFLIPHVIRWGYREFSFKIKRNIESVIRKEITACVREETASAEHSSDADDKEYLSFLKNTLDVENAFGMAAMLFLDYVDGATSMSDSIGGGGGGCTSGWGKKKDDDDDEKWARRCARQAVKMCKPWHIGRRRGRGR